MVGHLTTEDEYRRTLEYLESFTEIHVGNQSVLTDVRDLWESIEMDETTCKTTIIYAKDNEVSDSYKDESSLTKVTGSFTRIS